MLHGYSTSPLEAGGVPTCDSVHTWQHYSAASLEQQAAGTMICYPTQSHIILTLSQPVILFPILALRSSTLLW